MHGRKTSISPNPRTDEIIHHCTNIDFFIESWLSFCIIDMTFTDELPIEHNHKSGAVDKARVIVR